MAMEKIRVHEIAKEYSITSGDVIELAGENNLEVKSLTMLSPEEHELLDHAIRQAVLEKRFNFRDKEEIEEEKKEVTPKVKRKESIVLTQEDLSKMEIANPFIEQRIPQEYYDANPSMHFTFVRTRRHREFIRNGYVNAYIESPTDEAYLDSDSILMMIPEDQYIEKIQKNVLARDLRMRKNNPAMRREPSMDRSFNVSLRK